MNEMCVCELRVSICLCKSSVCLCKSSVCLCKSSVCLCKSGMCLCRSSMCLCKSSLCLCAMFTELVEDAYFYYAHIIHNNDQVLVHMFIIILHYIRTPSFDQFDKSHHMMMENRVIVDLHDG